MRRRVLGGKASRLHSPKGDSATKRRERKPLGETVDYCLVVARLNRKDRAHFESCFDWDCVRCKEMFHEN